MKSPFLFVLCAVAALWSCKDTPDNMVWKEKRVVVTAYNSLPRQTKRHHSNIAAWGDTLRPGMQSIAVSRDLLRLGLVRGTKVEIEGLEGTWVVLDKMNRRFKNRIDLYMGIDVQAAREWGVQKRDIRWQVERHSTYDKRYMYVPDSAVVQHLP
jgi:3D (Asp-Asp-Asp) domain-containing protein